MMVFALDHYKIIWASRDKNCLHAKGIITRSKDNSFLIYLQNNFIFIFIYYYYFFLKKATYISLILYIILNLKKI